MIFESLYEAMKHGELLCVNGGMCHWHLRRDGQLTIREILSYRKGAGSEMLERLKEQKSNGATSIFAKCPEELCANKWYQHKGFKFQGTERTRSGRRLKLWRLPL